MIPGAKPRKSSGTACSTRDTTSLTGCSRTEDSQSTCVDEWWNHLKLGIDTTVDLEDIRHKRPQLKPFVSRPRTG